MKVVKLNRTHNLYHRGFTYAFRFTSSWSPGVREIETVLGNLYGVSVNNPNWDYYWNTKKGWDNAIYWIGVKDQSMITLALLMKN